MPSGIQDITQKIQNADHVLVAFVASVDAKCGLVLN